MMQRLFVVPKKLTQRAAGVGKGSLVLGAQRGSLGCVFSNGGRLCVRDFSAESDASASAVPSGGSSAGVQKKTQKKTLFDTCFDKLAGFIFRTGLSSVERYDGIRMYKLCAAHSAKHGFIKNCGINDDFMGHMNIIMLHVWMCMRVIREDTESDHKKLSYILFETLWDDTQVRISQEPDMSPWLVSKYLKQVQEYAMGSLLAYDKAMQIYEKSDDCDPLLGAIWRNMYEADLDIDRAHLTQMRDYMFKQLENMQQIKEENREVFFTGNFEWCEPPNTTPQPSEEADTLSESFAYNKMFNGEEQTTWTI